MNKKRELRTKIPTNGGVATKVSFLELFTANQSRKLYELENFDTALVSILRNRGLELSIIVITMKQKELSVRESNRYADLEIGSGVRTSICVPLDE